MESPEPMPRAEPGLLDVQGPIGGLARGLGGRVVGGTGAVQGCTYSKHGFYSGACRFLGIWGGGFERPCLSGVLFYIDRGGTWPKTHNGWVAG